MIDAMERKIINGLQGGFPITERPFAEAAARLGIDEDVLVARIRRLCAEGWLSRFGPMYDADRFGGGTSLAAMAVPDERFETVAAQLNARPEVAHNYQRAHALNMWFVIAAESPDRIERVITEIESETGLTVIAMPKLEEFFIGARFEA
jgi:DNA-binding Lrp family transcriptional regulator